MWPEREATGGSLPDCIDATPGAFNAGGSTWVAEVDISNSSSAVLRYLAFIGLPNFVGGIAINPTGELHVAGSTQKGAVPISANAYQGSYAGGGTDAFALKLNAAGSSLVYSTYLGSSGEDTANTIAVDRFGNAVVSGTTSSTSFPHSRTFGTDVTSIGFATRFKPDGTGYSYSDLLLGAAPHSAGVDSAGNAYIAGGTSSTRLPLAIPIQTTLKGARDVFFGNLSTPGVLTTSTYLGGGSADDAYGIIVDRFWNSYVVGSTKSSDYAVTTNAYQRTRKGAEAAFLTKIIIESDLSLAASASTNPVTHGANLKYTYAVTNRGPNNSDGDTLTTTIPSGTTFQSFSTTAGTCSHPPLNGTGTFTCSRGSLLLSGHSWGPIALTVKVNAASGATLSNTAKVNAKTQDVFQTNNTKSVSVKVN